MIYEVANKMSSYRLIKNATVHQIIPMSVANKVRSDWNREHEKIAELFFKQKIMRVDYDRMSSFTKDQAKGVLPDGFDKNKKNIVIFNGTYR